MEPILRRVLRRARRRLVDHAKEAVAKVKCYLWSKSYDGKPPKKEPTPAGWDPVKLE